MRTLSCDLLVIGSGAGGLSAAVTAAHHGLDVVLVEKDTAMGGATAWSGGWMWTPRHPLHEGPREDIEQPRTYLKNALGQRYDADRVDAFLHAAPHMVGFFHEKTATRFVDGGGIADIHGDLPGASQGGRQVGPKPVNGWRLKPSLLRKLTRQMYETSFLGMGIMAGPDLQKFLHVMSGPQNFAHAAWRVGLHTVDMAVRRRGMQLVNGPALIARLAKSADDLGVRMYVDAPAKRLLLEGKAVCGAVVATPRGGVEVWARRGTVLATGGFPNDAERTAALFPKGTGENHKTLSPATTTGDGIRMAEEAGAVLDTSGASLAAWCPVSLVPFTNGRVGRFPHIIDRGKPGVIGVLRDGRRFVNEADGYHQYVDAMIRATPEGEEVASWLICDHRYQRRMPFGMSRPFPLPRFPYLRNGYLRHGRTLEELSVTCGIDPTQLRRTVDEFNAGAIRGIDPEFGRGRTAYNRKSGDFAHGPNPSLGPIENAPFYAIKVYPGSFGTFAGLSADAHARVLDAAGDPIEGLYAVGTDQANVLGGHYPSGGINIGPAMTFGYVAARHAAGVAEYEVGI
ncbi:FAD-dependent oxidoreductase [Streptomyces longispororuber]|uniref:FAD-dependent oxidoreductase n=1 Tax=Streptomyces longispororuber TaxID=68230 RepID=UPI002108DEF9|nr:FAD-dependent oxidoreductase [Streptomyces longispororuber]MCQ4209416.1 FAD-dependent oxidoreductase [Streptomyces longispororuber]